MVSTIHATMAAMEDEISQLEPCLGGLAECERNCLGMNQRMLQVAVEVDSLGREVIFRVTVWEDVKSLPETRSNKLPLQKNLLLL